VQRVGIIPESGEGLTHHHQGRTASGGALAPQLPRAHWIGSEPGKIFGKKMSLKNEWKLFLKKRVLEDFR